MLTLIHNHNCSKSNAALKILEAANVSYSVRNYLVDPLEYQELVELLALLQLPAINLVRTKDPLWLDNYAGQNFSENELLQLLVKEPVLLQRPILVFDHKALIARPTELIHAFLGI